MSNEIFVVLSHSKGSNSSAGAWYYTDRKLAEEKAADLLVTMATIIDSTEVVSLCNYNLGVSCE